MPWVPLQESSVPHQFSSIDTATMTDSIVSFERTTDENSEWSLDFSPQIVSQVRVSVQHYTSIGGQSGNSYAPAEFRWDGHASQINVAAPYPATTFPDNDPVSAFTPSIIEPSDTQALSYAPARVTIDQIPADQSFSFLIEVWEDGPATVSYNCECDDPNPSRTLAELRTELMVRLGFSAQTANPPPGMPALLNSFLQGAQRSLYRQYTVLRTERFFSWALIPNVRFYDLADNEDVCTKELDPRMITWAGISDGPQCWRPLICGIPPECYTQPQVISWPTRYEIRQCIEVWPAPSDSNLRLRIKGHFGLEPFAADGDQCTIDDEAVFLFALARAKAHYRQPDAANYQTDAMNYIRNLTAGKHQTRRYVPGEVQYVSPPPPLWLPSS